MTTLERDQRSGTVVRFLISS